MIPLQQLLSRFKNLANTDKQKKEKIIEVFKSENIDVSLGQISLMRDAIVLKLPPIIKTEVLLKKETLIKKIKQSLGSEQYKKIQ